MRTVVATLAAAGLALAGCVHVEERHESHHEHVEARRGPPPHAPAHGYRHKHRTLDLRYDQVLGVYVVIGHPDHFFHEGYYFRRASSRWERCRSWKKADWTVVAVEIVPVQLAKHYKGKGPKHGKAKGHSKGGPAKHDD